MSIAQSKLTAQGRISIPVEVRKKLGIGPGSAIEWHEQDDGVTVRRASRYSWEDIHRELFPTPLPAGKPNDVKAAITKHMRKRHMVL
jgi:hypothetical protein